MAASTIRLSITCFRVCPGTSYEKCRQSSKTSVELTQSLITRPACSSPTGKSCNTCTRLVRRSASLCTPVHVRSIKIQHNSGVPHQKRGKANFDLVYDLEDPREYFGTFEELDYCIPQHGQRVFSALIEARGEEGHNGFGERRTGVVDVCCSYGINAALLKHELTLNDLYARYGSGELASLSSEELAEADTAFYGGCVRRAAPQVVGVDVSRNAVSYGLRSGILDLGFAENLEDDEPTEELGRAVSGADLLTVTGVWGISPSAPL